MSQTDFGPNQEAPQTAALRNRAAYVALSAVLFIGALGVIGFLFGWLADTVLYGVNRHSKLPPYRHPILTPLMQSRPGAA